MLVPTNETKEIMKNIFEELRSKIKGRISSIRSTNNSDDYDQKHMKIKFNLDDNLPLIKMLELCNVIIVLDLFFMKATNSTFECFVDECLYKL